MPNWVVNTLAITHADPKCIDRIVKGYEAGALFSEFLPEPYDLEREGKDQIDDVINIDGDIIKVGRGPRWYVWRNEHWGTKWDVGNNDGQLERISPNEVRLLFSTAWREPFPIFQRWVELGYEVFASSDEETGNFASVFANGRVVDVISKNIFDDDNVDDNDEIAEVSDFVEKN